MWVPGISDRAGRRAARRDCRRHARGFTLIELMVVVVIVGIAAAAVTIRVFPDPSRALREDGDRLAQLFAIAQGEVRADGRRITWQADGEGYRFERRVRIWKPGASAPTLAPRPNLDIFQRDDMLRARRWTDGPVRIELDPPGPLVFTSEWIPAPQRVRLRNGAATITIVRDEAGRYAVH